MGRLRLRLAEVLQQKQMLRSDPDRREFLWVHRFPLFTPGEHPETGAPRWEATHHPFTAPDERDLELLDSAPELVHGQHYDLVLNGTEIGGGSIRIHSAELQEYILRRVMQVRSYHMSVSVISKLTHNS